jgi:hypothetical protein
MSQPYDGTLVFRRPDGALMHEAIALRAASVSDAQVLAELEGRVRAFGQLEGG